MRLHAEYLRGITRVKIISTSIALTLIALMTQAVPASAATVNVAMIGLGGNAGYALYENGEMVAWGANGGGALGDGTLVDRLSPGPVTRGEIPGEVRINSLSGGNGNAYAIDGSGRVYAWGNNLDGQLGIGSMSTPITTPTAVKQGAIPANVRIVKVTASIGSAAALGHDGKAYAWGGAGGASSLGDGSNLSSPEPVAVIAGEIPAGVRLVDIAASAGGALALGDNGRLYAWGGGTSGQLGNGLNQPSTTPVQVSQGEIPDGVTVTAIRASSATYYALGSDGNVYAWGQNTNGKVGNNSTTNVSTPVRVHRGAVPTDVKIVDIRALSNGMVVLGNNGQMYAWGQNIFGQLGNGTKTNSSVPVAVSRGAIPDSVRITSLTQGFASTDVMVEGSDRELYVWGRNYFGQLLTGDKLEQLTPIRLNLTHPEVAEQTATTLTAELDDAGKATLTATVKAGSANVPGGGVDFYAGATKLNDTPVAVTDGIATFTTDALAMGAHSFTATYAPAAGYLASTSSAVEVTVAGTITPGSPTITGTAAVGATLTVDAGTWAPDDVTLGYQWKRDGQDIADATGKTYTPVPADRGATITVLVQATKTGYTDASATTPGVTIAAGSLTKTPTPSITGTAKVGSTLTASPGTWDEGVTLTYQWKRDGASITDATASTYTATTTDHGKAITVEVTGTKAGYESVTKTSTAVTVAAGTITKTPTPVVTGTAKVASVVRVTRGAWDEGVSFSYQWKRDGRAISGATKTWYKVAPADAGKRLTVTVTGRKSGYATRSKTSARTRIVAKGTLTSVKPRITGTAKAGRTLRLTRGSWTPAPVTYSYRWYANGKAITGATKTTYKVKTAHKGKKITVKVTGRKSGYTTKTVTSAAKTIARR